MSPLRLPPLHDAWTLEQRLGIARRHLMAAARKADEQGLKEKHRAILGAVTQIDDAEEAS
jgi:hypothetical protein